MRNSAPTVLRIVLRKAMVQLGGRVGASSVATITGELVFARLKLEILGGRLENPREIVTWNVVELRER
mgnify:CR=1 FL=1